MAGEREDDLKDKASYDFAQVIQDTRTNYQDPDYHPEVYRETQRYKHYGIRRTRFPGWTSVDGTGTKPEMAERLSTLSNPPDHELFGGLVRDALGMVEGDAARFGWYLIGLNQAVDVNAAQPEVMSVLARGAKTACDAAGIALLNGETAELGYRMSGWGPVHVNINAVGVSVLNPDKLILGDRLAPGQPIIAAREQLRSNGFTRARAILEASWLNNQGWKSKREYILSRLGTMSPSERGSVHFDEESFDSLDQLLGHNFEEQVLVPWHKLYPDVARELLTPSTLFSPLVRTALGGIDGEKLVDITGMAHISGGGIPLKAELMLKDRGLGAHIETAHPDPRGVTMLLELAQRLPPEIGSKLINDREACQQWNRGLGFLIVCATERDAQTLIDLGPAHNVELAPAGRITDERKIEFRGHTWTY